MTILFEDCHLRSEQRCAMLYLVYNILPLIPLIPRYSWLKSNTKILVFPFSCSNRYYSKSSHYRSLIPQLKSLYAL